MSHVIGMDIGTSGLKSVVINKKGHVVDEYHVTYKTSHPYSGYSEMDPEIWYEAVIESLDYLLHKEAGKKVSGISFSGQMHGLVTIDENGDSIRPAILWNDTRNTKQVKQILDSVTLDNLLENTSNTVLEGFTLPKLLWVRENEFENYKKVHKIMLPKDYIVYRLTGNVYSEPSDFAGTIMYDVKKETFAYDLLNELDIDVDICPEIIPSHGKSGVIKDEVKKQLNISRDINIYQGGADNACGALGSGITDESRQLVSIGTSGVALAIENSSEFKNDGSVHYFNHCVPNQKYIMGVTLSSGSSLEWLKEILDANVSFETFIKGFTDSPIGSNGLLFAPFLHGERTPYNDANIRGSFIGLDRSTNKNDLKRAVIEGISFSINESIAIMRDHGLNIKNIVSIGGGAKNKEWLNVQADLFNAKIYTRTEEQGPAFGAAMLAAMGEGWFSSFDNMIDEFIDYNEEIQPRKENSEKYKKLFEIYKKLYSQTIELSKELREFK